MFAVAGITGKVGAARRRLIPVTAAQPAGYKAMSMEDDLAHRSPDIERIVTV
jgi:hypothetical protein